jgi:mono/diheme cytochrome c family protein
MQKLRIAIVASCMFFASVAFGETVDGRKLYQGLASFSHPAMGLAGPLPKAIVVCGNCHGARGEGRFEGGAQVPSIQLAKLRATYANDTEILGAIERGISHRNGKLSPLMPRYLLSDQERSALINYLARIGTPLDLPQGVTKDIIRVGVLLPLRGPVAVAAKSALAGFEKAAADVNARNGIYGRKIELVVEDSSPGAELAAEKLAQRDVFMVLGGFWPANIRNPEPVFQQHHITLLAALLSPEQNSSEGWSSYLLAANSMQEKLLQQSVSDCRVSGTGAIVEDAKTWVPTGLGSCVGLTLRQAPELQAKIPDALQQRIVLPFPASVLEKPSEPLWERLGLASGRIAFEALSESGAVLYEKAPLEALARLRGFEPLPGAPVQFSKSQNTAWNPDLLILDTKQNSSEGAISAAGN